MEPIKMLIEPRFKKDNGQVTIDLDALPITAFTIAYRSTVSIPVGGIAGNHKHERQEALLGLDENLIFAWLDEGSNLHEEKMKDGESIYLFITPPWLPHAIKNTGDHAATVVELAEPLTPNFERVTVIQ